MLNHLEFEVLAATRDALKRLPRGLREERIAQAARTLNCSPQTVYRKLKSAGFDSGRKQRSDAGEGLLDMDQLRLISGVLMASINGKGQRMTVGTAIGMVVASLAQRGQVFPAVSESTVSRQLYRHKLHPEQLCLPTQSVQLTSKHPNHVWQVDSTTGAYYYLPGGRLRWMDEAEFNKNKVANLVKASTDLLTRWSAADHTTHAFKVRYYLGGESAANLIDFMVWAIWKQEAHPMCGVPLILMTDQGPANKSHLMAEFCRRLGIEHLMHAPGNARATGSVEKSHDLARMHLETRYHFQDPATVTLEKLRLDAEAWAAAYCATRVHTRHGRTRAGAWMEINRYPEALRMPASLEALRDAATSRPETPRVTNDMRISYRGKQYRLDGVPGVVAGLRVTVQMNVFRDPAVDVQFKCQDTGEVTWHVVEPEARNEWGFDGERVIGERHQGVANSVLDAGRNAGLKQAYKLGDGLPTLEEAKAARKRHQQAYAGVIDPLADVAATPLPAFLPRRATPLELPTRKVELQPLSVVEACKRLRLQLGEAYSPQVYSWVAAKFPAGVPEEQLAGIVEAFRPQAAAPDVAPGGLRVVGGGQ